MATSLPETRDYVPKVYAAVKIIENPDYYGFSSIRNAISQNMKLSRFRVGVKLSWIEKKDWSS